MKKLLFLFLFPIIIFGQTGKTTSPAYVKARIADSASVVRAEFKVVDDSLASDIAANVTAIANIADSNFVLTSETSAWDKTASDDFVKSDTVATLFTQTDALAKLNVADSTGTGYATQTDIATKVDEDFSLYTVYTAPQSADLIVVQKEDDNSSAKVELASLPISTDVSTSLGTKVSTTDFNDTVAYFVSEIQRLEQLINSRTDPDVTITPYSVTGLASTQVPSHSTSSITLTWDTNGLYVLVYRSTDGINFTLRDSSNTGSYTDSGIEPRYSNPYSYYVRTSDGAGTLSNLDTAITNYGNGYNGVISDFISKNWYVSNAVAGAGTGVSWATAALYTSFSPTTPLPGDTVFIDGGTDSLKYTSTNYFKIQAVGTANDKIVYTRGTDAGHSGRPIFRLAYNTTAIYYPINFISARYVELSYIETDTSRAGYRSVNISTGCNNISILHNVFNYATSTALEMTNVSDITVMNNTFTSGSEGITYSNDAIKSNQGITNLEVAYNTFIGTNNSDYTGNHNDFFQASGGTAGNMLFHHNFYYTATGLQQAIYAEYAGGIWKIYNNVVYFADGITTPSGFINLENQVGGINTGNMSVHLWNNTIYSGENLGLGIYAADTLDIKNNIFGFGGTGTFAASLTTTNTAGDPKSLSNYTFNNNIYRKPSGSPINVAGITNWTTWTVTNAKDADSYTGASTITFDNEGGSSAIDYRLASASAYGIDGGLDLSSYFTTDYRDTSRTGLTWDVGAFENFGDELVSNGTFTSNITDWSGSISTAKWYNTNWNAITSLPSSCLLDSATGTSSVRVSQSLASPLEVGKTYRITFDYYLPSTNTTVNGIRPEDYVASTDYFTGIKTVTNTWTSVSVDYIADQANDDIEFKMWVNAGTTGVTVGDKFYIDNVSLKEIL